MAESAVSRRDFLQRLGPALGTLAGAWQQEVEAAAGELALLSRRAMYCQFEIALPEAEGPALAAGQEALGLAGALERQLSVFLPESELSRLNAEAASRPVALEQGLFDLLWRCRQWWEQTGGAFDPSAGPLMCLWREAATAGRPPAPSQVEALRPLVGMGQVRLDPQGRTVRFGRPGMSLDLGAVGKGYAVDRIAQRLQQQGVASALVHAGHSSIYALGAPPWGKGWSLEVADPRPGRPPVVRLHLCGRGMSTSGAGMRGFEHAGRRYGHLLDPRTGWPAEALLGVSAVAASAAEAEALSTALFTLGPVAGRELLAGWPGACALLVAAEGSGLQLETVGSACDWEVLSGTGEAA